MALKISLILLFVLLLSKSLFVDASPLFKHDYNKRCDITKNSKEPKGLPTSLTPPAKFKFLLYGSGVQIYQCNTTSPKSWSFVGPKANLFVNPKKKPIGDHFFQPTPVNGGRATWNSTLDCDHSSVITKTIQTYSVGTKDIPWLLTQTTKNKGDKGEAFSDVSYVVRINTKGGVSPSVDECKTNGDLFKSYYTTQYWYFH
ncbi:hypothetical protein RclHR1_05730012 [Rhizophagus clarus]|uniref:DUF3455 domain-containing protein n=1 Tax=Rhizophagus clarus TaxID=94130 RepID=A0A2Z6RP24_9GLOM|nr:hypothetical protein RclHR1_05730012 [Rhizophagus clarus]GET02439.1 DUF3455 domain-containing protein [Rhizophagus clarus]